MIDSEFFMDFFGKMLNRLTEKQPKYKDSWKTVTIEELRERLIFIIGKSLKRRNSIEEDKSLIDLANQAMLLWIRKKLEVKL